MGKAGVLLLKLDYSPNYVQNARLTVPLLGIDERIGKFLRMDRLPAGRYPGTLTLFRVNGSEVQRSLTLNIEPNQHNLHELNLKSIIDEIYLRPVNSLNRTVTRCEIKVERVDNNFRVVREDRGIAYRLAPGNYTVRVILPDLKVKTLPLRVEENVTDYLLQLDVEAPSTRREPRYRMSVPVVYRTNDGQWVSTNSTNMSRSGLCLVKGIRRISDKELFVRLFVPVQKGPLECNAEVRWIRDERTSTSRMGLKLRLAEATRAPLEQWLEHASGGAQE
jgi:hypothetical protein